MCVDPHFPSNEYLIYIILPSVPESASPEVHLCPLFFERSLSPLSEAVRRILHDDGLGLALQPRGMVILQEMQHLINRFGLARELYLCPSASGI